MSITHLNNSASNNVKKQLDNLDENFMDYLCYWNEKYYRNGFCDSIELIIGCIDK